MKVLLVGDFSIVNNALKEGLEHFGVNVTIASIGDALGEIPRDIDLRSRYETKNKKSSIFLVALYNRIVNTIHCLRCLNKLYDYDIVQFISFASFGNVFFPHYFIEKVIDNNKKSILYSCGTDLAYAKGLLSGKFKYITYDEPEKLLKTFLKREKSYNRSIKKTDLIIPAIYDYQVGMSAYKNCGKILTFPFLIKETEIKIIKANTNTPIVIYYSPRSIVKQETKGAKFILKALDIIQNTQKDKVEIIINERVEYEEYVDNLRRTDILIDQCRSYGYAMAAITGMSLGKVVLSGAEKEAIEPLNVDFCPVVNITPDVDQIVEVLSDLINDSDRINYLKKKSVEYVKQYHDSKVVASQFLSVYKELLDSNEE
ncbi:MAG: hypothetical protein PHS54_07110 [Clostridia bacterium]|nr:hypothetical protein [Clostridia bacterium]